MNTKLTRWLMLAAGIVMAHTAHRAADAGVPIIALQTGLVGLLAVFAWGIFYNHRSPKRAYNEGPNH